MVGELVNPYIAGAPVTEARMFFGREDVFGWIQNSLVGKYADHILVIHGQRRVGKTSVLKQLRNRLPQRYIPVFFDLQGRTHTTLDRFLWWLAREIVRVLKQDWGIEIPLPEKDTFSADLEYFESHFLASLLPVLDNRSLLLTFDEFDNLEENEIKETLARPLVDYLRRLMGRQGLNFIFSIGSSGRKLENMQAAYTEFFKTALYKKISFLNEKQTHDLIIRPVEGILEYDKAAVNRIYRIAGGHPYFTQLTCHELFAGCQQTGETSIREKDVEAVLDDVVERGTVNLKFVWDEASDIEKWTLATLAHLDKTDNRTLADSLRNQRVRFSESDLISGLLHLREKDILTQENRFVIHLLRLWLQKNRSIEQVREELTEVNPIANRYIEIGLEFRDSHLYDKAIESFREALAVAGDNIQARVNIALTYLDQKAYSNAVVEFEKALTIDEEDVSARAGLCEAHLALGDAAMQRSRTKDAIQSYQRVLAINAEHTEARQRMADINRERAEKALVDGKDEDALSAFAEALKFTPEDVSLVARYGQAKVEKRAKVIASLLIKADKERTAQNWAGVLSILQSALELDPTAEDIQKRIAFVKEEKRKAQLADILAGADQAAQSERWKEVIVALDEYLSIDTGNEKIQRRLEEAKHQFHAAKVEAALGRARALARQEKFEQALSAWEEYINLAPEQRESVQGEIEKVKRDQSLLNVYTEAQAAFTRKNYDRAIALFKEIIVQDETFRDVSRRMAESIELRRAAAPTLFSRRLLAFTKGLIAIIAVAGLGIGAYFTWNQWEKNRGSNLAGPIETINAPPSNTPPATAPAMPPTQAATPPPTATSDSRVLNPANQHFYLLIEQPASWHDARDYCASQGGHLGTIQDAEENKFIYQVANAHSWLGATDKAAEGTWVWVSGEPWEYTNWDSNQPDDGDANFPGQEHYLVFSTDAGSSPFWNDIRAEEAQSFVCEWEPASPALEADSIQLTWKRLSIGLDFPRDMVTEVVVNPVNPKIIFFGAREDPAGTQTYLSTDQGQSWQKISAPGYRLVYNADGTILYRGGQNKILFSKDDGKTWSTLSPPINGTLNVATHPLNPARLFALYRNRSNPIYFSEDGGQTWTNSKGGFINSNDYFPQLYFAKGGAMIYAVTDQVNRSDNSGREWHQCAWDGTGSSSVIQGSSSAVAIDPNNSDTVFAAASSTGIRLTRTECADWRRFDRGLSNQLVNTIAIDPNNPKTLYAGTAGNGAYISFNSGAYWQPINDGLPNAAAAYAIVVDSQSNVFAAMSDGLYKLESK